LYKYLKAQIIEGKKSLSTLEELSIGFVSFSPLDKGFLTGKINENTTFQS